MSAQAFVVAKDDLKKTALIDIETSPAEHLPDDALLLLKVDRFAFTANNMTYAVTGNTLKYWSLFPAPEGYGNIPVWGFGEVIESRHEQIEKGERLFGYFPMATHLVIEAADVSKRGLRDGAAHRQGVSPIYNAYSRVGSDAAFAGKQGDYQALLRPLFMLSFVVDDFLAEHRFFGATQVILSSASSKTAFGLAHLLHKRQGLRVIGLTSAANEAFVRSLGCYDDVVSYDAIDTLPRATTAYVDMAGSADLRRRLHAQFAEKLVYSGRVGLTHLDPDQSDADMPGAKPVWFFAPDQIRKRAKEWGPGGLDQRFGAAWQTLAPQLDRWIGVTETRGPEGVQQVYLNTLGGKVKPAEAHILSLWP